MTQDFPVINFERITIDCAQEIKKTFLQTLETEKGAILDFEQTETIDLAGIQLLLTFFREAVQRGISVQCRGTLSESLTGRFRLFGFCGESCGSSERLCETLHHYFGER